MRLDQSMLTGEARVANKQSDTCAGVKLEITRKENIIFSGTLVSNGSGVCIVTEIGMRTEMGQIQAEMEAAAGDASDTPLKQKLKEFGDWLAKVIGILCCVIWIINFPNFFDPAYSSWVIGCLAYFKIAVALAVAAIPEGLPAVITTCLALGTRQMARKKAIVRKLPSVETLGCTTVICSDKTGTLTTNEMVVQKFAMFGNTLQDDIIVSGVEGFNYEPKGTVDLLEKNPMTKFKNLSSFLMCCSQNNEAKLML